MTLMHALTWGTEELKKHRVTDAPAIDAQVLLAAALEMTKTWIFSHFDAELPPAREEGYRACIARRLEHEPVAYIIGWKEFYKRKFLVNPSVLIPRPATETLVDEALRVASESSQEKVLFADIGTGSGAIAVTLAAESGIPVVATDINEEALTTAKQNANLHQVFDLIDFRLGSLVEPVAKIFEKLKAAKRRSPILHLVVCANLPYLTPHQWETATPDIARFEPKDALVSGVDGLDAYWELSRELTRQRALLPHRVTTLWEIDPAQRDRITTLIQHDAPHAKPSIKKDLDGFNRVVVCER